MAKSRESFERRQRERAKKAKADAKRERRFSHEDDPASSPVDAGPQVDENAVIDKLAELHAAFDNEEISFDDFEARRSELLTRLQVD
jgi:acetyl-CoA acetyltransferase